ncbi:MAG: ankyrin repeat domain-containing protein [Candidatus Babeliales bacterium]
MKKIFTLLSFALIIHGTSFSSEKDSKNFFGVPEAAPFKLTDEAYEKKLEEGWKKIIKEAYNKKPQKQGFDKYGYTPLIHAIRVEKNKTKVEKLLAEGASVNERDIRTFTPLHYAALEGDIEIINILIQCKANLNAQTDNGQTPLHWAKDGKTVKCLLSLGALILKDNNLETPLLYEIGSPLFEEDATDAAIELIKSGKEDLNNASFLECAIELQNFKIITSLVQAGAKVNIVSNSGYTPLHTALHEFVFKRGNLSIVQYLLSKGADVNGGITRGTTPLHLAVYSKNKELCKLLCKAGADITIKDEENRTPFDLALEHWK